MHNPQSVSYQRSVAKFTAQLQKFLSSDLHKQVLVTHALHTTVWKYNHQTLWLEMSKDGTNRVPVYGKFAQPGKAMALLQQISVHHSITGLQESFYDILEHYPDRARELVNQWYETQREYLIAETLRRFTAMANEGYLD